jgi:hypothetical protein
MFDSESARMLLQVERVVLNALAGKCGFPSEICAYHECFPSSSGKADSPESE